MDRVAGKPSGPREGQFGIRQLLVATGWLSAGFAVGAIAWREGSFFSAAAAAAAIFAGIAELVNHTGARMVIVLMLPIGLAVLFLLELFHLMSRS